jgi:hypothetical protein
MKTAMQELIEYLKSLAFSKCHLGMGDIMLTQGHIDELEEKYIEKEKEQIMDAYENGYEACDMDEVMEVNKKLTSGDLYYNMNYNQNK